MPIVSLQGKKIVTAKEMARMESQSASSEEKREAYMNVAGAKVAEVAVSFASKKRFAKSAAILIGKGNKGGDAFVAARKLLEKGFFVRAFSLADLDDASPLCRLQGKRFLEAGGDLHFLESAQDLFFKGSSFIIDGIFGTGFEGALEGLALNVVEKANASSLPIISIDIPSGLNGSTGEVVTSAIKASVTVYLGLPKIGFFLQKGYNHIGQLIGVDFGLEEKDTAAIKPLAYLVAEENLFKALPPIVRTRHKYQRGLVIAVAGSKGMGGAAKLSSLAALRAGAGMVRLFYEKDAEIEMENTPFEVIREAWHLEKMDKIIEAGAKAGAYLIGPGMGREAKSEDFFRALLPKIEKPAVLDADALFLLAKHLSLKLPEKTILTPHRQEMLRLLGEDTVPHEWLFIEKCKAFAKQHKVTLILKGAPTFVFCPPEEPFIIPRGDPGMATAGAGDVLTGILAALFAQGLDAYHAALLGVYLHDIAGELAAKDLTSYAVIASDLIEYLPKAYKSLLR